MEHQKFYNPAGSTTRLPKPKLVSQSPYFKGSASKPSGQSRKPTKRNNYSIPIVDLTGPIPKKKVAERQEARDGSTRTQGKSSIVNDNPIRKTSVGGRDDDDDDFLPEVDDLISGEHWRSVLTASPGPGRTAAEQPADNRGQEDGVLHNRYKSGSRSGAGAGARAGTRALVNSKDKLATPNTGKPCSGPPHYGTQSLKSTTVDDQTGFTSISSILSNIMVSHPGANTESTNGINGSQSPNDQTHNTSGSTNKPDQEASAPKSRHHEQRQRSPDSSNDANSIRSGPLGSPTGESAYGKAPAEVAARNVFAYNRTNRVPYNQLGSKEVDKRPEKPVEIISVSEYSPTPFKNSNRGNSKRIINDIGAQGEVSVPDRSETMQRSGSGSDNASDYTSNQNSNTLQEQGSGSWNGLDCTHTTGIGRSNSRDELVGEKLQDESAEMINDFCAPSPTEVDEDLYGEYLRSKKVNSGQDGDQHSVQTPSRSGSAMEHCISSNPAGGNASSRRAYSQRAHQENAISKHGPAKNANRPDPVSQLSLEQQSQYAPLQIEAPLSSIDAPPRNTPAQKRSALSINPSAPPQDGQSAKRRKISRGKTVKAKRVKKTGQLLLLDPHKEKKLLYAYPPDEKNNGYTVECIEAVQLTDDGSMLSTVRWTSLEVPTDSLVGEEYHSQFEGLFKTEFGEKEWDLQREKRLQKMRRYPRHGEDNDYIVEYVEALRVAEDGSVQCTVRWASSTVSEGDLGEDLLKQAEKLFEEKYGGEKWERQLRKKQEATN